MKGRGRFQARRATIFPTRISYSHKKALEKLECFGRMRVEGLAVRAQPAEAGADIDAAGAGAGLVRVVEQAALVESLQQPLAVQPRKTGPM